MVWETVQEAPFGQLVRLLSGNRFFKYPEELPDFTLPEGYGHIDEDDEKAAASAGIDESRPLSEVTAVNDAVPNPADLEKIESVSSSNSSGSSHAGMAHVATVDVERAQGSPHGTVGRRMSSAAAQRTVSRYSQAWLDMEQRAAVERTKSMAVVPEKTVDGIVLVDWYSTDDQANPQNWSQGKKAFVALQIEYERTETVILRS